MGLFTSGCRSDQEIDRLISAVKAAMQLLYWTVVVKQEQCPQAKLLVYQLIYVLTFTYGQLWSEIIFLSGVCGLIPRDPGETWIRDAVPLYREVVHASGQDACQWRCSGHV